jgi:fructan beta-fructosidase
MGMKPPLPCGWSVREHGMKHFKYSGLGLAALMLAAAGVPAAAGRPDIVIADFEGDTYGGWKAEGTAFGSAPASGKIGHQMKVDGFAGRGLVNSFHGGDRSEGTLTSPKFTIERPYIRFLIGGGGYADETYMELLVDGRQVRKATGPNTKPGGSERLEPECWDVTGFEGKTAVIRIVDRRRGGWGHINIDQIVQSSKGLLSLEASFTVEGSHLIVPVSNRDSKSTRLRLGIFTDGAKVQDFTVNLPEDGQSYWLSAYPLGPLGIQRGDPITVRPDAGRRVRADLEEAFSLIRTGRAEEVYRTDDYDHPYRNQFHVSSRHGWNNDPNGLVYADGLYHMYYQYNPFGIRWGNMHWGHWTSSNLVHWTEHPIALYQRTTGDMMFSGGGFIDFNNSAGFGKGTQFAAFTSTGRGECLAYSTDGGMTFTELEENPIVVHRGRDPKVIWYEPERKWVMVVYDTAECAETKAVPAEGDQRHIFANAAFYESRDLRRWTRTGAFTHPDRTAVFECPELFELAVEGKPDEKHWIFYAAQNRFFIGHFDGKTFTAEQDPEGGGRGASYAAQTFSDVPDGRRIQVLWVRTRLHLKQHPDQITNQAMSLPHELTLRETDNGLRVHCRPVEEVKALRTGTLAEGRSLTQDEAHEMLQGVAGELSEILIEFEEPGAKTLKISGIDCSFKGRSARIFTDRTFSEIYIDDGHDYTIRALGENQLGNHETFLAGGGGVKALTIYRLSPIWNN